MREPKQFWSGEVGGVDFEGIGQGPCLEWLEQIEVDEVAKLAGEVEDRENIPMLRHVVRLLEDAE